MRNFQDTFERCERSFISAFSVCMTVPLSVQTLFLSDTDLVIKYVNLCQRQQMPKTYDNIKVDFL